ncbi:MAG: TMEM43 family protein [Rhizobiaceae bacterium]
MPDQFIEVTTKSWGSRILASFVGVLIGLILFVASFPLIFWNESRSVDRIKTLGEGRGIVVEIAPDNIDGARENALVHISGLAKTKDMLADPQFGIRENALKLNRTVEMYQWAEESESRKTQNFGGSETTETVYTYEKTWSEDRIDSSQFKKREGHENPSMPAYGSMQLTASDVKIGPFRLGDEFTKQISDFDDYQLSQKNFEAMNSSFKESFALTTKHFVSGNPSSPQVGAIRVSYQIARPMDLSVVGRQQRDTLQPYTAKHGTISLLESGLVSANDMFAQAEADNRAFTWLLRLAGFAMMWIGLGLTMKPISVIGSFIPFVGNILAAGTGLVSLVVALVLSAVTAAIAWIVFRPLIGIALLALAAALFFGGFKWLRGKAEGFMSAQKETSMQYGRPAQ